MFEVIRWVSMVLLWIAMAGNVWCFVRGVKLNRESEKLNDEFRDLIDKLRSDLTNPEK